MENANKFRELKLEQMEQYITEWFDNPTIEIARVVGHDDEEAYTISQNQDPIYIQIFKKGECKRDSIVSTNGIINDELRGLVEKCIDLDRQHEASKNITPVQKGE